MKKIISFSLWGSSEMYNLGAIENCKIALQIFPEWMCRIYVGTNTDHQTINSLKKFKNVEIVDMGVEATMKSMVWRFLPCSESDVDVMISRDADCRLSLREREAIDNWLDSSADFHIIRDHPHHNAPILGGLWGARNNILSDMKKLLYEFESTNTPDRKQYDQIFLGNIIYSAVKNNSYVNDAFFERKNILTTPRNKNGVYFLGEIFNGNNTHYSDEHRNLVDNYERTN